MLSVTPSMGLSWSVVIRGKTSPFLDALNHLLCNLPFSLHFHPLAPSNLGNTCWPQFYSWLSPLVLGDSSFVSEAWVCPSTEAVTLNSGAWLLLAHLWMRGAVKINSRTHSQVSWIWLQQGEGTFLRGIISYWGDEESWVEKVCISDLSML